MKRLRQLFGIDLRSLALFRIAIALQILFELANQARNLRVFYTDFGVLPRADAITLHAVDAPYSIYLMTGSTCGVACLFAIQGLFAVALMAGYRTRLAAFASWFMLVSLHGRNPEVTQAGDTLMRMLLFWGMFLPLGARCSIDNATDAADGAEGGDAAGGVGGQAAAGRRGSPVYLSMASFALLMQLPLMYWFAAGFKYNPVWLEGHAVERTLQISMYVTPFGQWMRQWTALLPYLTKATLLMEAFGPLLAFIPFATGGIRLVVIACFILFHLGMGSCLELGLFPSVAIIGWMAFLPPGAWDWLASRLCTPARTGLRIYYDGGCAFCKRTVLILRAFLLLPQTPIMPAQSDPAMEAAMKEHNSWVVVDHLGRQRFEFDALVYVLSVSPVAWPVAGLLDNRWPRALGTRWYQAVANNRSRADRWTKWLHPRPPKLQPTRAGSLCILAIFLYVLAWNVHNIDPDEKAYGKYLPAKYQWIGLALQVNQRWDMFAPFPLRLDGWFVVDAHLVNGERFDIWRHGPVVYDQKPANVAATFIDSRWRKYLEHVALADYGERPRSNFAAWLCRDWNSRHHGGEKVSRLTVYFIRTWINPDGKTPPERVPVGYHECDDGELAEK